MRDFETIKLSSNIVVMLFPISSKDKNEKKTAEMFCFEYIMSDSEWNMTLIYNKFLLQG